MGSTCGALENGQPCPKAGTWRPVLRIRVHRNHAPGEAEIGIAVCAEHREKRGQVSDWLTDDGWKKLSDALAAIGKARPDRALTELGWQAVS